MDLGDRMKMYEAAECERFLLPRLPIVSRMDGRAFHSFTRNLKRPFDDEFRQLMAQTTVRLVEETGAVIGYTQSDEISLVLWQEDEKSQVFFNGRRDKIVSILAAMTTAYFDEGRMGRGIGGSSWALFDARAWVVPSKEEAVNALIWREQDATRNSIQAAAQAQFSPAQLHGKKNDELQEMLFQEKGINWNDYPDMHKRGVYVQKRKELTRFSAAEISRLPEKHAARRNPDLEVERSIVKALEMPPLTKVINRVAVVFDGAEPKTEA